MSTTTQHDGAVITATREVEAKRAAGTVTWQVTEFEHGSFLLVAKGPGTQFLAHFDAEQWAAFQTLIAGTER